MPLPLVLSLDLTASLPDNLIENESHVLNASTGRIFALNYGGFYSTTVIVVRQSDSKTLVPGVDFLTLAPNDAITKITGMESMSIIAITDEANYADTYHVTYQAVGGDYSTNVDTVRDIIDTIDTATAVLEWGMILNKPAQFNAAPHLIDFRTELYGWEGLIASIQDLVSKVGDLSPAQIQAVLNTINSGLTQYKSSVNNQLASMQLQINAMLQAIPNVSGFIAGQAADVVDVRAKNGTNKFLRASNVADLEAIASIATTLASGETLTTTQRPLVLAVTNMAVDEGAAGVNVPSAVIPYIVSTQWAGNSVDNLNNMQYCIQTARSLVLHQGKQVTLQRTRKPLTAWQRVEFN